MDAKKNINKKLENHIASSVQPVLQAIKDVKSDIKSNQTICDAKLALVADINNFIDTNDLLSRREINTFSKQKILLNFEDAPKHLQFNPYIKTGYRTLLTPGMCIQSIFWWTNETINIWSHIFGLLLFICLTIVDIKILSTYNSLSDQIILGILLVCFQLCMTFSTIYHTFSCRSEKDFDCFLTYDLVGITLALLAIYISGIYYVFWCHETQRKIYILTIALIFIVALLIQLPRLNFHSNVKVFVFVAWGLYGVIPTLHWIVKMGGLHNEMVKLLVSRIIGMYLIFGAAFLIYITKIPERWLAGKVDFIGHSHNWWHMIVLAGFYYWHNTGILYLDFLRSSGCPNFLITS